MRAAQVPSLMMLTRYLEVSPKQDYLVQRIQGEEVGGGGEEGTGGNAWYSLQYCVSSPSPPPPPSPPFLFFFLLPLPPLQSLPRGVASLPFTGAQEVPGRDRAGTRTSLQTLRFSPLSSHSFYLFPTPPRSPHPCLSFPLFSLSVFSFLSSTSLSSSISSYSLSFSSSLSPPPLPHLSPLIPSPSPPLHPPPPASLSSFPLPLLLLPHPQPPFPYLRLSSTSCAPTWTVLCHPHPATLTARPLLPSSS